MATLIDFGAFRFHSKVRKVLHGSLMEAPFQRFSRGFLKAGVEKTRKKRWKRAPMLRKCNTFPNSSQKYCTDPSWRLFCARFLRGFQKTEFRKTRKKRVKKGLHEGSVQYFCRKQYTHHVASKSKKSIRVATLVDFKRFLLS